MLRAFCSPSRNVERLFSLDHDRAMNHECCHARQIARKNNCKKGLPQFVPKLEHSLTKNLCMSIEKNIQEEANSLI